MNERTTITMPLADQRMLLQIAANLGIPAQMDVWANAPIIATPNGADTMTFNPLENSEQAMDLVCMYEISWRWRRWLNGRIILEIYGYDINPGEKIPQCSFEYEGEMAGRPHFLRRAICELAECYTTKETRIK